MYELSTMWKRLKIVWHFKQRCKYDLRFLLKVENHNSNGRSSSIGSLRPVVNHAVEAPGIVLNCLRSSMPRMAGLTNSSPIKPSAILDKTAVNEIGGICLQISLIGFDFAIGATLAFVQTIGNRSGLGSISAYSCERLLTIYLWASIDFSFWKTEISDGHACI